MRPARRRSWCASGPPALTGAGDAFSGGVASRRAFGWSLLSRVEVFDSCIDDALAGRRASSLRWMGVTSDLDGAFGIRRVALGGVKLVPRGGGPWRRRGRGAGC